MGEGVVNLSPVVGCCCYGCCYSISGVGPVVVMLAAGTRHSGAVIMKKVCADKSEVLACVDQLHEAVHRRLIRLSGN